MSDKLILEGVFSKGYGTIPKLVMKDKDLTIEAKGIYAYLSSYAGAGETAFPSVDLICNDLGIGEKRFYKHRKLLEEKGYLKIERVRQERGFSKNIYTLCSVVTSQNDSIRSDTVSSQNDYLRNDHLQNDHLQNDHLQNDRTNNNSINNNIFNNNSINKDNNDNAEVPGSENLENQKSETKESESVDSKVIHQFYQENFGVETPYIAQELEYWVEDLSVELVLEALKRTAEYGGEFGYAKRIMKNWEKKGIDTMEKVQQADVAFEQKHNKRYQNSYNKKPRKTETLPDWAKEDAVEETKAADAPVEGSSDIQSRLDRIRKLKEQHQNEVQE